MTTNHPAKLDPALVRPGRINKRIHLGYCNAETVLQLAEHYVGLPDPLPGRIRAEVEELCQGPRGITPAWVEQASAEADTVEELVAALRRLQEGASS